MTKAAIISIDGHVKAPRAEYRGYVEAAFQHRFDEWLAAQDGLADGFVRPSLGESSQWDVAERLAALDTQGVVAEALFPNGVAFGEGRLDQAPDPVITRQSNMAYNRWVVDFCAQAPHRLLGQALVAFDDVEQAASDVYWAREHGLRGILMPPLYPGGRFFFDPVLDPIWAACQETGLPLVQHGGVGAPNYQPAGFAAILTLATEHSFFSGRSMWQLMLGGVFDRFPDLKLAFTETEAWWMLPMIDQLDRRMRVGDDWTEWAQLLNRSRAFTRLASEYWQTNCYAGVSPFSSSQVSIDELGSHQPIERPGFTLRSSNVMFGVDYPHFESIFPETPKAVAELVGNPHVTSDDARRILYANAAELYKIDLASLQPEFDRVGFDLV